jgi:hypothetical protein
MLSQSVLNQENSKNVMGKVVVEVMNAFLMGKRDFVKVEIFVGLFLVL